MSIMMNLNENYFTRILVPIPFILISAYAHSQSDTPNPAFRARIDINAATDLQVLRDELNKASDANGRINPLGSFLERNAERSRIDSRPNLPDKESQQKPTLGSKLPKQNAAPVDKPAKGIIMLPGPRYTIIQQASPQVRSMIVDGFRPARFVSDLEANVQPSLEYPVSLASGNMPVIVQPNSVTSNFQEIPYGSQVTPSFGNAILPNTNILPNSPTTVPFNSSPANPGMFPPSNQPSGIYNPQPVYPGNTTGGPYVSSPIQQSVPQTVDGSTVAPTYNSPPTYIAPPSVPFQPGANTVPGGGVPFRSPSDSIMPNYPRTPAVVNGPPFVSSPPCQFDADYMVSPRVYRQSVDPCADLVRGAPSSYAPSPYATQPAGSPFSYIPPTAMPYNNNGYASGYRPLIGFGQTLNNAYLGRGIIGQPTAYVAGQPFRNFFRYIFP